MAKTTAYNKTSFFVSLKIIDDNIWMKFKQIGQCGAKALIEFFWSDLTFKQQNSRIYRSAGTLVLLLSRPEYSEVALECLQSGKSGNFVA
jgi:hypothetical protein